MTFCVPVREVVWWSWVKRFVASAGIVLLPEVCIPSVIKMTKFGWHSSWIGPVEADQGTADTVPAAVGRFL